MELEPRPEQPPATVTDADREAAAERLADAAGAGRLTLSEFSDRVGAVWAADTPARLATATAGIRDAAAGRDDADHLPGRLGDGRPAPVRAVAGFRAGCRPGR